MMIIIYNNIHIINSENHKIQKLYIVVTTQNYTLITVNETHFLTILTIIVNNKNEIAKHVTTPTD